MAQKWLTQLQANNAQNAFNAQSNYNEIDADGDGKLTSKELAQACNITILEAEELMEQYDANGDGTLDPQEFEDLKQQIFHQQQNDIPITKSINATTNYKDLDTNNDGNLTATELAAACNITYEEAQDVIMQFDADGDGTIDADEFEDLKVQILAQQRNMMTNNINANDTYNQFDADGDGRVDAKEFATACGISEQEAQNIIYQYDANGDGTLDQNEFEDLKQQILEQQRQKMTNKINANNTYNQFDADGDGRLDAKELAQVCGISEQEAQNVIYQYDANGDGQLDKNEFENLKQQILEQQRQKMTNKINVNDNYQQFDADGNGGLDAKELAQACGISEHEAQNVIYQYDANGDGQLDQNEFENLKQQILEQQRQKMTNKINANNTYNQFDADGDGRLDAKELAQVCGISEQEAQNVIYQYDANGDGKLDENEFENLKQQILEQQRKNMAGKMNVNDNYNQFDADGDGRLDAKELAKACGISEQEAQNVIYQYDANGDGTLDEQEFKELKQQILTQQGSNPFNENDEDKQEVYVTPSGVPINEDVAAYQAAVYGNKEPQMLINNNSNGRDAFVPYNQQKNAPQFSGDIDKVDRVEYGVKNSNAKAFGVDIFGNEKNNKPQNIYNNPNTIPQKNINTNVSPFGSKGGNMNNSPFGKPSVNNANNSPFGGKPSVNNANNSPFGQKKSSSFGTKPANAYNNKPKPTPPRGNKPTFKHQWCLDIKFDVKNEQIILKVTDDTTHKKWRNIVTKQDYYGDIKQEYFRLGKLINNGDAKYTYPPKGVGAVQVSLSKAHEVYNFYAQPI